MCFDDNYILPAMVTLDSLKRNAKHNFEVYIFDLNGTLSVENRNILKKWAKNAKIEMHIDDLKIDKEQFNFHTDSRISLASYGKIFTIAKMKKSFLYLDSDIFAQTNWDDIFDELTVVDSKSNFIGAKFEFNPLSSSSTNLAIRQSGDKYFNAGVLLIDPSKVDAESLLEATKEQLKNYKINGLWAHDQDLLNLIFSEDVYSLPPSFNQNLWTPGKFRPQLVHIEGFYKPWKMNISVFCVFLLLPIFVDLSYLFKKGAKYSRTKIFLEYKRRELKVVRELNRNILESAQGGTPIRIQNRRNLTLMLILRHLSKRFRGDTSVIKY